ncbi:HAMP domain-containing sensor histidine kinase [Ferrovum sp.]|uniref:sensor histidine kinase n=1 Tax=Ferrovum sp. TaxID=2609467 RepID=UPI0026121164|nr:HAMP domain-containing sensor histidine kinase [Ferrovum sp.]
MTLHARVLLHMPLVQLFFIGGVGWIVYPSVPLSTFILWCALALGVELLRAALAWWVLPRVDKLDPKRLHAAFMTLDALAGASTGLSAVLFLRHLSFVSQSLIEIILFSVAAAGVSVAVSSRYMTAAYSFLVLLGATIPWIGLHPDKSWAVMGLTLVYWLFLIRVATESERLLYRSVLIRQERDRIISTVSHDLRQPLHALSLYGAVLVSHPSAQTLQETRKNIDHIVRDLERMLADVLDLSKISAGNYPTQQNVFSLDTAVADICDEFDSSASAKGLKIRRTLNPVKISGDKLAVARIARNLIDNAIKFTEQGEVHVTTSSSQEGDPLLYVADTGQGIADTEQELIFREFYQINHSEEGTGLGLSIVRRLTKLMGARISVKSAPGQGSCFQVSFPPPPNGGIVALNLHR